MARALLVILFSVLLFTGATYAQATDTLATAATDTAIQQPTALDTTKYINVSSAQSLLVNGNKVVSNDIEQYNPSKRNGAAFVILMILLAAVTYLKTSFSKDLEELLQSVVNQNLSQQIFRSRSNEVSFASVLLNLNFIIVFSLYIRFILVKYFHVSSLESFSDILFLNFLFTFFYLGKIVLLMFIGVMFEVKEECEEYIYNFTTACKTLGLTLLPALFIFYTAPEKFFDFIFVISVLICTACVLFFVWRGLSTGYKLLYRSVYHFFVYVCVVEISTIFLLFKLLTKTII